MTDDPLFRRALLRAVVLAIVSLVLIPALTLAFTRYANHERDAAFVAEIEARIEADTRATASQKAEARAFYRSHPPSAACTDDDESDHDFREAVCGRWSPVWQFHVVERVAFWTLVGAVALFAVVVALGAAAFANRSIRYASFVAGWRLTTISSAAAVVVQSVLVVWLSFWATAYFWERYYIKLVGLAALGAGVAAFYAVYLLFRRFPGEHDIDGELVSPDQAPRLWTRVRELAARMQTAPPTQIIAGIDSNFFVTEAPCSVGGQPMTGRTLFVSIPLLRVLDRAEADAVLAHELAHLQGGDASSSALLGPKLTQFDHYCAQMRTGGLTVIGYHLLQLYRIVFAFALARDSRERELLADRTAAALIAPSAIARSLIKIAAYASYRNDVERALFDQDRQHVGALGIAGSVAAGLVPYAGSPAFVDAMKTADVPHPYDSHPPLVARMQNVGHSIAESDYGTIVTTRDGSTWADDIIHASDIEERLWRRYEGEFAENHEMTLAYRFEPATAAEREIVLKYFPPQTFPLANGQSLKVAYDGIERRPDGPDVPWDTVRALTFKGSVLGTSLIVTHHAKNRFRHKTTALKLKGLGKRRPAFDLAVNRYWQRHLVMRAHQREPEAVATGARDDGGSPPG